jgi:hypothetical protein|tara:strand:- start:1093 stop:1347 length:255 start_codon:yes stop_codon:yes gene_type:complete
MSNCLKNTKARINNFFNDKFEHPNEVNMTYLQHAKFSFQISFLFLKGAIKGIVHSIYPDVLITYSGDSMREIDLFLKNHRKDDE